MIGQHHPGIDIERPGASYRTNRGTKKVDVDSQQTAMAFQRIDREKVSAAGDAVATVVGHGVIISHAADNGLWPHPPYAGYKARRPTQ